MDEKFKAVGVFSDEGPPVPIPNTAVKLISAENTWLEATREDKAMPTQKNRFSKILKRLKCLNSSVGRFRCRRILRMMKAVTEQEKTRRVTSAPSEVNRLCF